MTQIRFPEMGLHFSNALLNVLMSPPPPFPIPLAGLLYEKSISSHSLWLDHFCFHRIILDLEDASLSFPYHGRDGGDHLSLSYFIDSEASMRPRVSCVGPCPGSGNEAQICPLPNCCFLCPNTASNATFTSKRTRSWET